MIEQILNWGEREEGRRSSQEKPLTQKMTSEKKEEETKPNKEEVNRATGTKFRVPSPASARADNSKIGNVAVARLEREGRERRLLESPEKHWTRDERPAVRCEEMRYREPPASPMRVREDTPLDEMESSEDDVWNVGAPISPRRRQPKVTQDEHETEEEATVTKILLGIRIPSHRNQLKSRACGALWGAPA